MSNTTPKQVVSTFFERLAAGDANGVIALFAEDGAVDMPGTDLFPWAGHWKGKARLEQYFKDLGAALQITAFSVDRWIVDGDFVSVSGLEEGTSRKSGKSYKAKWSWIFEVRNGKIQLWDAYEDTEGLYYCRPWK